MNKDAFLENIVEQIKEAQLKLGYVREMIRLYFPAQSLAGLLDVEYGNGKDFLEKLAGDAFFKKTPLGEISFVLRSGDRIEVQISPEGAAYVHEKIADPPFLKKMIELFSVDHNPSLEKIKDLFATFNPNFICEKMEPGTDFDYSFHFPNGEPDAWYYCIHEEMGHTIYHRFTKKDYQALLM